MVEKIMPQDPLDEPRWEPDTEDAVETGVTTPLEADQQEGLVEVDIPASVSPEAEADEAIEKELERLEDHGFSRGVAERMLGIKKEEAPGTKQSKGSRHTRPGWVKDGSRRKIRTSADARAADRVSDDEWMLR